MPETKAQTDNREGLLMSSVAMLARKMNEAAVEARVRFNRAFDAAYRLGHCNHVENETTYEAISVARRAAQDLEHALELALTAQCAYDNLPPRDES